MNPARAKVGCDPTGHPQPQLLLQSHKWPWPAWPWLQCQGKLSSTGTWTARPKWRGTGESFKHARKEKVSGQGLCSVQQPQSRHLNTLLKLWTDSATNWNKSGDMFPMFSSTHGLISPTSIFSAPSHSSSPRAAALCHHHLPHCTRHLPHKCPRPVLSSGNVPQMLLCCHGHHALGMAVTRTARLSQGWPTHPSTPNTHRWQPFCT